MASVLDECVKDYLKSIDIPETGLYHHPNGEGSLDLTYHVSLQYLCQAFLWLPAVLVKQRRQRFIGAIIDEIWRNTTSSTHSVCTS